MYANLFNYFHYIYFPVFLLGGYSNIIRKIMLQARKLGLTKPGYSFITYELLLDSCLPLNIKAGEVEECEALDGILDISLFVPQDESYLNFSKLVRNKMSEAPFYKTMSPYEIVSNSYIFAVRIIY